MRTEMILSVVILLLIACDKEPKFKIGQEHEGGIIFYVDPSGEHGLIAARVDQGEAEWGCQTEDFWSRRDSYRNWATKHY